MTEPATDNPAQAPGPRRRGTRRTAVGVVTSAAAAKTLRVQVNRIVKEPRYGKYLRRRTVLYVHDPHERARLGDSVEIMECRPISKTKRWRLVRVVRSIAGAKPDAAGDDPQERAS